MVGIHLHPAAGDDAKEVGREAQVPLGGARHPGRHLRRSDLSARLQHRADAISARSRTRAKGE